MAYASLPVNLDPPNWNQLHLQQSHQQQAPNHAGESDAARDAYQLLSLPNQQRSMDQTLPGPAAGSVRSGSMSERARLAKIPPPEPALECPRCDSTNTKFCYFNNYNLSQPRHFCKNCRRYWTRGGALRNVPVGGGCRRNKRSKSSSRSKSSASTGVQLPNAMAGAIPGLVSAATAVDGGVSAVARPVYPAINQLPSLPSLNPFSDVYGDTSAVMGMYYGAGFQTAFPGNFQLGSSSGVELEHIPQSHQQLSLYGGEQQSEANSSTGLLVPFSGEDNRVIDAITMAGRLVRSQSTTTSVTSELGRVKIEESGTLPLGLNLVRRPYFGVPGRNHFWDASVAAKTSDTTSSRVAAAWTDLASFASPSAGNRM